MIKPSFASTLLLLLLPFYAACGSGSGSGSSNPPSGLSYAVNPAVYTQGFAITPNTPTVTGNVTGWAIAPALPAGLAFSTTTGAISGTPLTTQAATDYTVTASNGNGSTDVVLSIELLAPSARALYVANFTDSTIGSFHVGSLIHSGYALSTGTNPRAIAGRPDGAFLYTANDASNNVSTYAVDPVSGRLTASGSAVAAGSQPSALVADHTGDFLYCANKASDSITVFAIDAGAPVFASTTSTGTDPVALALHPTGAHLYAANSTSDDIERFSVDDVTGALVSGGIVASAGAPNALAIATTPAGSFLYVVNRTAETIGQYSIDPGTGALAPLAPPTVSTGGGSGPSDVVAHPDGTFLYVSNLDADTIGQYAIDQVTGALTPLTVPTVATGDGPGTLAIGPAGLKLFVATQLDVEVAEFAVAGDGSLTHVESVRTRSTPTDLYLGPAELAFQVSSAHAYIANVTDATVSQYSVDTTAVDLDNLSPASLATTGPSPRGIAIHQDGTLVLASSETGFNISLFTRDPATGLLTLGGGQAANNTSDLGFEPSGRFAYATVRLSGVQPYTVDTALPDLVPLTDIVIGSDPRGFDIDPTGQFLYLSDTVTGVFQMRINATTGELTSLGSIAAGGSTREVIVHPSGRFAYAANTTGNSISQYAINPVTGTLSALVPPSVSTGVGTGPEGMDFTTLGDDLYVALQGTNQVAHLSVDPATGLLTLVGTHMTFSSTPRTVAVDASGTLVAAGNTASTGIVTIFSRDTGTGVLTGAGFAASDDGPTAIAFSFDIE